MIQNFINQEFIPWNPSQGSTHDDQLDTLAQMFSPRIRAFIRFPQKSTAMPQTEYDKQQRSRMIHQRKSLRDSAWGI